MAQNIKYCKYCVLPSNRPNIFFDNKTECCSVCYRLKIEKKKINWKIRRKKFAKITNIIKKKKGFYDCVIPVSGGKDSTWQVIMALKYGLKPLCVSWKTPVRSRIGSRNLKNLISLGVHHIDFTINEKVEKYFTLKAYKKFGMPLIPMHMALHAIPLQIAIKFKIPLIIWGENSGIEYGSSNKKKISSEYMNSEWRKAYDNTNNTKAKDWLDKNLSLKDLSPYIMPSENEKKKIGVKEIFLGHYFKWTPENSYRVAKKNGFKESVKTRIGLYKFADIDDRFLLNVHHWLKWYKFGFTRLWDNYSIEIRNKKITRNQAKLKILKTGYKFPRNEIMSFCDYTNISVKEFLNIAEKFRNKKIWYKDKDGKWKIKNFLLKNWRWKKNET